MSFKINTYFKIIDVTVNQIAEKFKEKLMSLFKDLIILPHKPLKEVATIYLISVDTYIGLVIYMVNF